MSEHPGIAHRFTGEWIEVEGAPAYRMCDWPGCPLGQTAPDPDGEWTYEVIVRVQVHMTGVERDRRDGDTGEIRRAALAELEAAPPHITDTEVVGWWPTNEYREVEHVR